MDFTSWPSIVALVLSSGLAFWGLFHQLIVGAAVTMGSENDENAARTFVMSWVAQGAFMSFVGILTGVIVVLHGITAPVSQTVFLLASLGMLFLGGHVLLTGYQTHVKPVRIGAVIELIYGIYFMFIVIVL